MAAKTFKLEIITPHQKVFTGEARSLVAPGAEGYFGVLPGHAPLVMGLGVGEIAIKNGNESQFFATSGGITEVFQEAVTVLAEAAEQAPEIDVERAQKAKQRALKRLSEKQEEVNIARAESALVRAVNRLQVASKRT